MSHPAWLHMDQNGCTQLHVAVQDKQTDEAVLSVLAQIALESNAREIVNIADDRGNTPLHFALQTCSLDIIATLIRLGADLFVANQKNITPIILISQLPAEAQLFLLRQSGRATRENVLRFYKDLLLQFPNLVHARDVYCRYAGTHD
jgi:ankyrin repeat protein